MIFGFLVVVVTRKTIFDAEVAQTPRHLPSPPFDRSLCSHIVTCDIAEVRRRHVRELEPLQGAEVLGGQLVAPLDWIAADVVGVALASEWAAHDDARFGVPVHQTEEDVVRASLRRCTEHRRILPSQEVALDGLIDVKGVA